MSRPDEIDEFADLLDVAEEPVNTAQVKQKPQTNVAPAKAEETSSDEDVGSIITFGSKISPYPVERFKAAKDNKYIICMMSTRVQSIRTHFVEGLGNFICFGGKCCELETAPRVRYLIPIIEYETSTQGTIVPGGNIQFKCLCLGSDQYESLINVISGTGKEPTAVNISVSCTDDKYQKLTFAASMNTPCNWKSNPKAKELIEEYKAKKHLLYTPVAKRISEATYSQKKGFLNKQKEETEAVNVQVVDANSVDDMLE